MLTARSFFEVKTHKNIEIMKTFKLILIGLVLFIGNNTNSCAQIKNRVDNKDNLKRLLKSVKSEYSTKTYKYNKDLTLHSIEEESNRKKRNETKFVYKNGKVSEVLWEDFIYKSKAKRILEYKGDLLVKETGFVDNEIVHIVEHFYNENNQLIKQIQKLEWNDELNKQTRVVDIHHIEGKNKLEVKYNGVLTFIVTYDDKTNPIANIKGYSQIYAAHQFYGITNNVLSWERVYKNGKKGDIEKSDLTFDATGKYLTESIKKNVDIKLICKNTYTYN